MNTAIQGLWGLAAIYASLIVLTWCKMAYIWWRTQR